MILSRWAQVMWSIKGSLEKEKTDKNNILQSEGWKEGERIRLSHQFVLGLGEELCPGYIYWAYRVIRLVQQVTQENHILLATPNNFRSSLSSDIRATFLFFILEDRLPGLAMSLPIIFHPVGTVSGRQPWEQCTPRVIKHSWTEEASELEIGMAWRKASTT